MRNHEKFSASADASSGNPSVWDYKDLRPSRSDLARLSMAFTCRRVSEGVGLRPLEGLVGEVSSQRHASSSDRYCGVSPKASR